MEPLNNVTVLVGGIAKTYTHIEEPFIHLIHLDVDVYTPIKFVLDALWPRIAPHGFILVDDYGFTTCKGAKKAVDDFMARTRDCASNSIFSPGNAS